MAKKRTDLIYTLLGYIVILAILVVVALIIGGGVYLLLINGIRPSLDSLRKWIGLTGSTLVTFAFAIKESRCHWNNKLFWAALTGLLIVHLACFLALFSFIQHWTVVWFFPDLYLRDSRYHISRRPDCEPGEVSSPVIDAAEM